MAKPTYTASIVGKEKANAAFKRSGKTQDFFAGVSGTHRQLISKFLNGLSVEQPKFIAICDALKLRWQEIAELDEVEVTDDSKLKELELLVQEVRQKIADVVIEQCGAMETMRELDMTQPVDLDRIYTDVNILEKISGKDRVKPNEVLPNRNKEDFDRWMMGKIKERIAGLEAVETHKKLMVLGKPGSGKTTFLKYLAISCLNGKFHSELVPIFVSLRTYSEAKGSPSLEEYILDELQHCKVTKEEAEILLGNGKALILLDGLDEVKDEHDDRVRQDIETFSIRRLKNRFAITCRIAAEGEAFKRFTDVEVADFDNKQIEIFINKWFSGKDQTNVEILLEKLSNNQPVKELAKTPLLLTQICFLFEDCHDLSTKRSDLYEDSLKVLMKKWGAKRKVERDHIYKNLSLQSKQDMLGKIALRGFKNGEYVFKKEDLQRQIECICNLSNSDDSEDMLKAIEYHHGLLVERAKNIYSFSHLTFQEYFTAREIVRKKHFEILVQNISNPRWKEVFYLTSEILRRSDSDVLLRLMKVQIDAILKGNEDLEEFLLWLDKKVYSASQKYKKATLRAYFAYISFSFSIIKNSVNLDLNNENTKNLAALFSRGFEKSDILKIACDLDNTFSYDISCEFNLDINCKVIQESLQIIQMSENGCMYEPIEGQGFFQWFGNNGLERRCIDNLSKSFEFGCQFIPRRIEAFVKYYAANLLLVECMNCSDVSEQVREEIESTLLLPISSIPNAEL